MVIDNFDTIENFMEFNLGTYYKFEALIRNTDGYNVLNKNKNSNTKKNVLIKSWYIENLKDYKNLKEEMITLCNLTGARLYITLDRKSIKKTLLTLFDTINIKIKDMLYTKDEFIGLHFGIKNLSNIFESCSSKIESSDKDSKTYLFDVDIVDSRLIDAIYNFIKYSTTKKINIYILKTKKGYHIICKKIFEKNIWKDSIKQYLRPELHYLLNNVSLSENSLGLVYYNKEGE